MGLRYLHRLPPVPLVDRERFLLDFVRGTRVLHLGCVDSGLLEEKVASGELLHCQLESVAGSVLGVDLDAQGVERLRSLGITNCVVGDAEELEAVTELRGQSFDIVLAGEVIEHVGNALRFLQSCRRKLSPGGHLVLTTPNASRLQNFLFPALGFELVHPDHTGCFTPVTLGNLVREAGLTPERFLVYQLRDRWPRSDGRTPLQYSLRVAFFLARWLLVRPLVHLVPWWADGLVVVAGAATQVPQAGALPGRDG